MSARLSPTGLVKNSNWGGQENKAANPVNVRTEAMSPRASQERHFDRHGVTPEQVCAFALTRTPLSLEC